MQALNDTKNTLFSIIAHDIKNPFNTVLGFSELLKKRYKKLTDDKRDLYINTVYDSSRNIFRLLDNMLHWSRAQLGTIRHTPIEIRLIDVIKEIILISKESAKSKENTISVDVPDNLSLVVDPILLRTVLHNLLSNAIKFTRKGEIKISVSIKESSCVISISDNGIGMDEETRDSLFQIKKGKSTEGTEGETGTGLGLIICKEFMEIIGGKIWVESAFDKGTTFYVEIKNRVL